MRFIYIMSELDKQKMLALGYILAKEDIRNQIWVFHNKDTETFSCKDEMSMADIRFAMSNTLTF